MCDTDLLEKLSVFSARTHILPFLKDFDKRNARRITPSEGIRALQAAGLTLTVEEQEQIKAAYTDEADKFCYDALISDVNNVRPVGYFESNPNLNSGLSSPKARFNFTGVCSPTLFAPRINLSDEEETALSHVLREIRYESMSYALDLAEFMRPFDDTHRGSVTTERFVRQMMTQYKRLKKSDVELLCKAYAASDNRVRYAALGKDVEEGLAAEGHSLRAPPAKSTPHAAPLSPAAKLTLSMQSFTPSEETREGFRVLIRTIHERRIRIADVIRDFGLRSPFPGRITKEQLIRALSLVGGEASSIEPRVMAAIAATYALRSDPGWCDYNACIRDLEATNYLRHLESLDPDFQNLTFSREVAASPNPRYVKPHLAEDEEQEVGQLISTLAHKCARNRVFNVRIFAKQYDKNGDGFLTLERFLRVLSTLHILPATQRGIDLLVKHYTTPKGLDYQGLLRDCNLT